MRTLFSRQELSRTLANHCAFAASAKMLEGDDRATLAHLRKLRKRIRDERGEVFERVLRNLQAIVKAEQDGRA